MKPGDRVHFIGIGGISMSGIASILLKKGYNISGSDIKDSHLLKELRSKGAKITIGHDVKNIEGADLAVISSAIPDTNPELIYAKKNDIPVMKRARVIAEFMKKQKGIAISGTHGKTTTTSMVATILMEGKIDPTILIGGELDSIGGNAHYGTGEYLIAEADESDGSFLYYDPEVVIVTNVEMDHKDYFKSEKNLFDHFKNFLNKIPVKGKAIVCNEDDDLMKIVATTKLEKNQIITYGFDKGDYQAVDYNLFPFGSLFRLVIGGKDYGEINLQIPGKHNILNSLAAIAAGKHSGMNIDEIKKGIESYTGVRRRFEKKGLLEDILIIDDYAHHPTEIEATLKAARNTGYERIIAVFQPHRYSRTSFLLEEFSQAFDLVDHLIVTDIYSAGENPISGVKAEDLVRKIAKKKDYRVDFISGIENIVEYLKKIVKSRDLVITIGAGDVYRVGELFLKKMKKNRKNA